MESAASEFDERTCYAAPRLLGRVAEWQTRTVQVRVSVRTWGFNSPLAHFSRWLVSSTRWAG